MSIRNLILSVTIPAAFLSANAWSQGAESDYPSKPITIVVGYPGDGSTFLEWRMYAQAMTEATGKRFIMDPRGGGGTTIGTAFVAKAAPDGYTVLGASSPFTIAPSVYPDLPYDNIRDFRAVSLMSKKVYLLLVHPDSPIKTVQDYVAFARANPGKLNFGTGGLGAATHLPGELLHFMTGTKATFVHYKRSSERITDLMAKRTDAALSSPLAQYANVKAGKLRAIGVTSLQRLPLILDLPTIDEQGVKGYDVSNWIGMVAPAKVSTNIVNRLHGMLMLATKDPNVVKRLQTDASIIVGSAPEEFQRHLVAETNRWRNLIKETGIKPADDD
jgi:tripartite-type tricarboxylate transporter receptor subunit TctC